jgi:type II secretory pathway predicted ATPase ExeA
MDYYQHFGLTRPPFEIVGQPTSLYMSRAHREGLAALEWGLLHEPGCFTLLMGDVGTGKTTLINVILSRNYEYARIAYVMNPKLSFEEMLRVILEQLGYLATATTKLELLKKFEWLFEQLRPKERIAIIIDEAQGLSDEILEELRLFSNHTQNGRSHLEILLVGQPELLTRLMEPSLRQFHQRIGARAVLNRLQRDEAFEYVDLKLRESGGSVGAIFAKGALAELVDHSQGIPRQLNLLCNNALIRAYGADLRWVTLGVARAAIREYENLPATAVEFRKSLVRRGIHSMTSHPAVSLTGLGLLILGVLYCLGVRPPTIQLTRRAESRSVASANAKQFGVALVDHTNRGATIEPSDSRASLGGAPAGETVEPSTSRPANNWDATDSNQAAKPIRQTGALNPHPGTQPRSKDTLALSVQSGDTIEKLALRHLGSEVNIQSVVEANPQLRDVNRIYPGETVFLPYDRSQQPR